ncbi:MAG: Cobalamin-independent synthase, N-terminal domain [Chloroflexota bacterium]|nr:Cobalamin-independent synthase, N-terminal domain [Chloroflexota bacterium]
MFATLLGPLPRPPLVAGASDRTIVEAAVQAQEAAGLEPITDGGLGGPGSPVERWRITAGFTTRAVKQALIGPYTIGRAGAAGPAVEAATLAAADALNTDLRALADAGCPVIEVHEPAAIAIGVDARERALFRESHRRLLEGLDGPHLSLAITGGSADAAGTETLLSAPYASFAVDLIAGPDNWRLVVATPGDRGIICGVVSPEPGSDDGPELLLWAAGYAASTGNRGPVRVGLATASSLAGLSWDAAIAKLGRLGDAARMADLPQDELRRSLDPRAVDIRSAALGRVEPHPGPRRRRSPPGR